MTIARWAAGAAVTAIAVVGAPSMAGAQADPAPTPMPTRGPVAGLLAGVLGLVNSVAAPVQPGDGALLTLGSGSAVLGVLPAHASDVVDGAIQGAVAAPAIGLDLLGLQVGVLQPAVATAAATPPVVVPETAPAATVPVTPVVPTPSPARSDESGRTDTVAAINPDETQVLGERQISDDDLFASAMSAARDGDDDRSTVASVLDIAGDSGPITTVFVALAAIFAAVLGASMTRRRDSFAADPDREGQA